MRTFKILGCILALALSSCHFATFNARPGVVVKAYPKEMYGTYQAIEKHDGVTDTFHVTINEKGARMDGGIMKNYIDLSDTNNTLSHLGDFYYLNVRDKDTAGIYWTVYPFEQKGKYLYIYSLPLGKAIKKMGKYLKPSGRKKGDYIMDNEGFRKYCEKHLKKRKALKLKRIK